MWLIVEGRRQGVAVERFHDQCCQDNNDEGEGHAESRPNRCTHDRSANVAAADATAGHISAAHVSAADSTGCHGTTPDVSAGDERCSFRRYGSMQRRDVFIRGAPPGRVFASRRSRRVLQLDKDLAAIAAVARAE